MWKRHSTPTGWCHGAWRCCLQGGVNHCRGWCGRRYSYSRLCRDRLSAQCQCRGFTCVFGKLVSKIKRTRRVHRILTDPPHYLVTHKRCVVTPQGFKPWTFRTGIWRSIQLSYGAGIVQTESRTPNLFECFAEVQPIFCKDSANREQKVKLAWTFCRGAAYLVQR